MKNTDLKQTYDTMHKTGKSAWFDDGQEERKAILEMGQPWEGKTVLEIGCGEGDLLNMISNSGGRVIGVDYSEKAIEKGRKKYNGVLPLINVNYRNIRQEDKESSEIIVMQGVMEHFDEPFAELKWIIDKFKPKTVITSMPGFLNTRGIIWHTLDMLGAVMSKTDLHFIDPWEVEQFCLKHSYKYQYDSIDYNWGEGDKMIEDLLKRIPLALKDGGITLDRIKFSKFITRLYALPYYTAPNRMGGAINIYRIDL